MTRADAVARCYSENTKAFLAKSELGVPYHYKQLSDRAGWLEQAVWPSLLDLCMPAYKDHNNDHPVVFHILNATLRQAVEKLYPNGVVPADDAREIVCFLGNEGDHFLRHDVTKSDVDTIAANFARDLLAERFGQ